MAEIVVRLLAGDDEERSFSLSQEFASEVARLPGVTSRAPPSVSPDTGKRGDLIIFGALVIASVSGGGALTALISTIGSYLARDRRTEVEIQTSDGRKVRISFQKFKQKEMEELLRQSLAMNGNFATSMGQDSRREREQLIAMARVRLGTCVNNGYLTEEQFEEAIALLKRDEAMLFPHDRRFRDDIIRFLKGEASFLEVFRTTLIPHRSPSFPPMRLPEIPQTSATQPKPELAEKSITLPKSEAAVSVENRTSSGKYVVWYATNRRPNDPIDPNKGFSAQRDRTVHYGTCRVSIPKSHKIGSTGSPWWKRILTWTDDRLKLLETTSIDTVTYWMNLATHLDQITEDDNSGVVFLHGYNVSFSDAALRAAQIGFDLQIKGAMSFFSWPSQGTLDGYSADEATIEASEDTIAEYLVDFATKSGASKVHIIAHSMGNRGLLRAVIRLVSMAEQRSQIRFDQIVLAAADVDADVFRRDSSAYAKIARRTTLYISSRDRAVEASKWLHNYPRAGLMPPIMIAPGIDTINVVNVDITTLGHGYIAEARAVLTDIFHLFREGKAPENRFGIAAITSRQHEAYWEIRG
jgi:esterase/lipase superfamily enzyme